MLGGGPPCIGRKDMGIVIYPPPFFSVSVMALKGVEATPLFKFLVTALESIMRICQFLGRGVSIFIFSEITNLSTKMYQIKS